MLCNIVLVSAIQQGKSRHDYTYVTSLLSFPPLSIPLLSVAEHQAGPLCAVHSFSPAPYCTHGRASMSALLSSFVPFFPPLCQVYFSISASLLRKAYFFTNGVNYKNKINCCLRRIRILEANDACRSATHPFDRETDTRDGLAEHDTASKVKENSFAFLLTFATVVKTKCMR